MARTASRFLLFIAMLTSAHSVRAVPLNVVNPGFEDITGETVVNEFTFGPLNGWDLYDPNGITAGGMGGTYYIGTLTPFEPDPINNPGVYANFPGGAAEGQRVGIAFNFEGSDGQGEYGFEQVLTETLQPSTQYTLQVEIGNITSATSMGGQFFPLEGFPGYRVDLFTEDETGLQRNLDSDDNSLAGLIEDGEFGTSTVTFTTGVSHPQFGEQLGIRLVNLNQLDPDFPQSDIEVDFDDVRLDAATVTAGDLNADGSVNGIDFLQLQRGFGEQYSAEDLVTWSTNYANPPLASAITVVPEPTMTVQCLLMTLICSSISFRQNV